MHRATVQRLCIGALTLLVAAGCGGGDDFDETNDPELEAAVRAYSADFLAGDAAAAYARVSERCHEVLEEGAFSTVVAQSAEAFGDAEITKYNSRVDGEKATATYEFSDPTINQEDQDWVLEDGTWHVDEC